MTDLTSEFLKTFEDIRLPEELAERFQTEDCLAQGAYSDTYLLSEKDTDKLYVLKRHRAEEGAPVVRNEAKLIQHLSHKGLPRFVCNVERDGMVFTVREFVDGITLDQYLAERTPDASQTIDIIIKLCDILSYLHSQPAPIIHRDIKPSNIIIDPAGRSVKLIDFGISRRYDINAKADTTFSGTMPFAAPEQHGYEQTDARSDLHALGVVMRLMLVGETQKGVRIPDQELGEIVRKCTEASKKDRYQSAVELKKALLRVKNHVGQKTVFTIVSVLVICAVFVAGVFIGRYTDFLALPSAESQAEQAVVFSEPLIEQAARLVLGKPDGETVTADDLALITEIAIRGDRVFLSFEDADAAWREAGYTQNDGTLLSLDDLRDMKNLQKLYLTNQPGLRNISALAEISGLLEARFHSCYISDFSPLTQLSRLYALDVLNSPVADYSVFGEIQALRQLALSTGYVEIRSISDLGDLSNLRQLDVAGSKLESLDGIENLTSLEWLNIRNNPVTDFSQLDGLPRLSELVIGADMEPYLNTLTNQNIHVAVEP
jgi:serine/threonine protein kinase